MDYIGFVDCRDLSAPINSVDFTIRDSSQDIYAWDPILYDGTERYRLVYTITRMVFEMDTRNLQANWWFPDGSYHPILMIGFTGAADAASLSLDLSIEGESVSLDQNWFEIDSFYATQEELDQRESERNIAEDSPSLTDDEIARLRKMSARIDELQKYLYELRKAHKDDRTILSNSDQALHNSIVSVDKRAMSYSAVGALSAFLLS